MVSSTKRNSEMRLPLDQYYTPATSVNSLLSVLSIPADTTFLEPCRGAGAIYDAVPARFKHWAELAENVDYLTTSFRRMNLIITNPPFSLAVEFLQKSLAEAGSVFYLLRLNFLGSKKRKEFWRANKPSHVMVLSERPCFAWVCKPCEALFRPEVYHICPHCGGPVKPQTDSIEYAWFGWDRYGICRLEPGVHVL